MWDYEVIQDGTEPCVAFTTVGVDGEEGYPGNLAIKVTYSLSNDNELALDYCVTTDADTPINMTNHSYFNLNGCDGERIHNNFLCIHADEYTPVTERLIPTGEYASVNNTAIDFRAGQPIGDALDNEDVTKY